MKRADAVAKIAETKLIAILRGDLWGRELDIVSSIAAGGMTALEVSIVSPNYAKTIRRLVREFGEFIAIGAGTVLTAEQVCEVADCGASFVVSPNCDPEVICATQKMEMASFPGAYTPTEILQANRWGADAVKIFPAISLGPQYISALRAPMPGVRFVPTGGITIQNISAYLAAGAWAIGLGSELMHTRDAENLDTVALVQKVCNFVAVARKDLNG